MMKVMITGATGMIGSHLCRALQDEGWEVAGLSRATSAARLSERPMSWKHYSGDILDRPFLERVWKQWRPDLVYHLAAQAYNGTSWEAEQTTYALNITGSHNVFEVCREITPGARVIPACSSASYGFVDADMLPIKEDRTPLCPITPYGVSKACMEMMARQYHCNYGLDVVLPRLFIHLGPDHPPVTAVQAFARQLALVELGRREAVIQVGNLSSSRDFVDVRDGVRALAMLGRLGKAGEAYNICTGVQRSIKEALDMLIEISGLKVQVRTDSALFRLSDEKVLTGDRTKIGDLGWEPRIPFRETLQDILRNWIERL